MNIVIWDIESSSSSTDFVSIIEIGGILVDENLVEKDRFNLRCRLPEGEIPQCNALLVNKTDVNMLTKTNLSHYQMLSQVEMIFKKWTKSTPAIFLGWSNIGFDDEMIRKEFFKSIRYPYLTNSAPNTRHDEKLPSVTTILSATKSEEEKAAIKNWQERVGFKEANRIKTEASSRGTSMHSYIEDYLRGRINESFFERLLKEVAIELMVLFIVVFKDSFKFIIS